MGEEARLEDMTKAEEKRFARKLILALLQWDEEVVRIELWYPSITYLSWLGPRGY